MDEKVVVLMQKMTDMAKRQADSAGFVWDNKHPTFRAMDSAFMANDYKALQDIYRDNFC